MGQSTLESELPEASFFQFSFRRFVRGRGGTSRNEPYGLADRSIDPDLGLYELISSHGASALDPKTNTSWIEPKPRSPSGDRSSAWESRFPHADAYKDVSRKRRKQEQYATAGNPRTQDFGPKIVFLGDGLARTFGCTRLPSV
jgi:hypothetical protein